MAFAGIDIGTSGCKLLVYDLEGHVIFRSSRKYREEGRDGFRELNPEVVLENVKIILSEAGKNCPENIEALAVASLGESVVCLDENNNILANSMLTGDCRGITEIQELIQHFGAQHIFEITGLPPNELYGLPKYMWLNQNTDVIKKAKAILYYEDFIGYILTGKRMVSYSSAARSMAFDIRKKEWSEELLGAAGISLQQMSVPVAPSTVIGTVLPEIAERLGLNHELKVIAGGHDQTCAALGSGLISSENGEIGMGTCEFMFTMLPEIKMTPYMIQNNFTCIPYVLNNTYLSSIEVTTCGILKNWARDTIFQGISMECKKQGKDFWGEMEDKAKNIHTDILLLPQFGSAGNPDLSMYAKGTITGLTIHTKPEEIYRAILEGMAFQMYLAYERMNVIGTKMKKIAATGGGSVSDLTLQIRADVFGMEVYSLESEEAGTLGCMLMSAVATGAYKSLKAGIKKTVRIKKCFKPDSEMHRYYNEKFKKYKELYELMHRFR